MKQKYERRGGEDYNFHAEVCGVDLDMVVQYDAEYRDNGFSHAFGYEERYEWEIDDVWGLEIVDDLGACVESTLIDIGVSKQNRKRWLRAKRNLVRKIRREIATCDPEDYVDADDLLESLYA